MSGISVDITGALAKNLVLKNIPKATRYQLTDFGNRSVETLRIRTGQMQKGLHKTSALARSIGTKIETVGDYYQLTIGTGLGRSAEANRMAQKYAWIQNYGGTIKAKNFWFMKTSGFGLAQGKRMKKLVFQTKDRKWHMVDQVTIPASYWFTATMDNMKKSLDSYFLKDSVILERAKQLAGGTHAS